MSWDPPPKDQQNGRIENYEVEYREEDSSTVVNDTTHYTMYTAEDLKADRLYQFRVAATTVNGTGPFSEWINVTTIPTGKGGCNWHECVCLRQECDCSPTTHK